MGGAEQKSKPNRVGASAAAASSQSSTSLRDQGWSRWTSRGAPLPAAHTATAMPLCRGPLAPDQSMATKRMKRSRPWSIGLPLRLVRFVPPGTGDHGLDPFALGATVADKDARPAAIMVGFPEGVRVRFD